MRASILTLTICLIAIPAYAKYSGGRGVPNDPYQIATVADLMLLGETPEDYDKHFILTADINLDPNLPGRKVFDKAVIASSDVNDATSWRYVETSFTGVFDGNSHTISHLMIEGDGYLGLFGGLAGAEIKNLGVVDVNITGSGDCVGGLVGFSGNGTVTQCYSTGEVSGSECVGGLVGLNLRSYHAHVTQCYSTATVNGSDYVGGLVGQNGGTVIHCYSAGAVTGIGDYVGGLLGAGFYGDNRIFGLGTMIHSFWDTQTSGQVRGGGGTSKTTAEMWTASTFLGWGGVPAVWTIDENVDYPRLAWERKPGMPLPALADFIAGSGTQQDPYLICTSDDLNTIGVFLFECDKHFKLMADIDLSGITYSQAVIPDFAGMFDGNGHTVSHLTIVGHGSLGLFGVLRDGVEVKNVGVMDVNIIGTGDNVGALVGSNSGSITSNHSTGTVSGRWSVGGLVGYNYGTVDRCHNDGLVTGSGQGVGGLVGQCRPDSAVSHCYNTGEVRGDWYVGGLVGDNSGGDVNQCYSTGLVSGTAYVGGLVGDNSGGDVNQCYSTGRVSGWNYIGGLVGHNTNEVTYCYSIGTVSCMGPSVGGLVGDNSSNGTVMQCFWDTQTSGQVKSSGGGTGKTTAEMQTASTFLDAGWDFVDETANGTADIWWIDEGKDYPRLWWELASDEPLRNVLQ